MNRRINITPELLKPHLGKQRNQIAEAIGVHRATLDRAMGRLGMKNRVGWNSKDPGRQFYLDRIGHKVLDVCKEINVNQKTVERHIHKHGLATRGKKICRLELIASDDDKYFVTMQFTCMVEGCSTRFPKDISLDVPEKRRAGMRFMCPSCKGSRSVETVHSFTGQ